jgi:hypothetical protein
MPPLKTAKAPAKPTAKSPAQNTLEALQAHPDMLGRLIEDANHWRELTGGGMQLALGNLKEGTQFVMGTLVGRVLDKNPSAVKVEVVRDGRPQTIEWSNATPVALLREPSLLPTPVSFVERKKAEPPQPPKAKATAPPPLARSIFDD